MYLGFSHLGIHKKSNHANNTKWQQKALNIIKNAVKVKFEE